MNYKDTLFLPETEFSMKASLPTNEPKILEKWKKEKLYEKLRNKSKKKNKFTLHDEIDLAEQTANCYKDKSQKKDELIETIKRKLKLINDSF